MGHKFIKDFKEGEIIESVYLVREKSLDSTKNGALYLSIELTDRTGMVDARKWDATRSLFNSFDVDGFIKIKGRVEIYKKYLQLKIDSLERFDDSLIDISLYIPVINRNRDDLFNSFMSNICDLKNPYLNKLVNNIFSNGDIADKFKSAPAATDFHHPYIGGLLEHTLYCIELARMISPKYPEIDIDLLIGGTALHDIGKIEELSYKRSFYYTDRGKLVGHIVLGVNLVDREISKIQNFPEDLKNLILHIIISHHGEYEWGSPKRPMSLEAVVLHHIDNLDAKINGFCHFVHTYNDPHSTWTKHSKMFNEVLYKKLNGDMHYETEVKYEEKG